MDDAVIDTCCLVNLFAVGDLRRVLPPLGWKWHVPTAVASEALFLSAGDPEDPSRKDAVSLRDSTDAAPFGSREPAGDEEMTFYVELAADLDDGEAMALAIARGRGWILATDDRKARRKAAELGVRVVTTPQIMRRWAELSGADKSAVRVALTRIEKLARFSPAPNFPDFEWWEAHKA